jgi:ElaB/YqjD/DUF883 family membrane-anchored ribosome-binding protein
MTNKPDFKQDNTSTKLDDIKHAAEQKYAEVKDKAIHLAHDASEKAAIAKDFIVEKSQKVKEQAVKAEKSASTYIKANPWKAVGIGAAIGVIIAKLFSSRK